MAFLCPVRIRRAKKTKDSDKPAVNTTNFGRITGSTSIETLVRVGLEKDNVMHHGLAADSKMVVLHDFSPCVDDEMEVKRGNIVNILYQENDWVYVIGENNQEGFIPHSYCAALGSQLADLTLNIRHKNVYGSSSSKDHDQEATSSELDDQFASSSSVDVHPFFKDPSGYYIVLYTFIARDENDLSVERGEPVTVLNKEDPDWYWVVRSDGQEGFVPSAFVCPVDMVQDSNFEQQQTSSNSVSNVNASSSSNFFHTNHQNDANSSSIDNVVNPSNPGQRSLPNIAGDEQELEMRFYGTELVMLYDYKAQAPDDLSVRRGDFIYANLDNQTVDGWLWVYSPKFKKYGFIPKAYARPPAMTSL